MYLHLYLDTFQKYLPQPYRWVNWWARNAPGGPTVMAGFVMGRDDSGIPRYVVLLSNQ